MKGLKFLASCMAVGAVSVACAAASFAAEWAKYVPATETTPGKATITIPADYVTAVGSGDFTLLILNKDETNITEQNKGCVVQIQQGAAADIASVTVGDLTPNTYYVRVGGADVSESNPNGFVATTMTVTAPSDEPEKVEKIIGDFMFNEDCDGEDANAILKYVAGIYEPEDIDFYVSAYAVEPYDDLDSEDANAIMYFNAGMYDKSGNVGYYGKFYYDETEDMYLLDGELYE